MWFINTYIYIVSILVFNIYLGISKSDICFYSSEEDRLSVHPNFDLKAMYLISNFAFKKFKLIECMHSVTIE